MIKCDELREPTSCLNRAEHDEPVFVLRANDPLFAATIRLWAAMAVRVHPDKIDGAMMTAEAGEKWNAGRQPAAAQQSAFGLSLAQQQQQKAKEDFHRRNIVGSAPQNLS